MNVIVIIGIIVAVYFLISAIIYLVTKDASKSLLWIGFILEAILDSDSINFD